jgi:hypothetical protein
MYQPYRDILLRLGQPLWWDESGVPRYEPFRPELTANIYAELRALIEIRCQGCQRIIPVSSVWSSMQVIAKNSEWEQYIVWDENGKNPLPKDGMPQEKHAGFCGYGDAPWHDYDGGFQGQCSGTTMGTGVVRVLEFWHRNNQFDWERMPEYEVYIGEDE